MESQSEDEGVQKEKQYRSPLEEWVWEGERIFPKFPPPSEENMKNWIEFVALASFHQNLLGHPDVECIVSLFGLLGTPVKIENPNILIEFGAPESIMTYEDTTFHQLQPYRINYTDTEEHFKLIFNHLNIEEQEFIPHLNATVIRKYSIMEEMKISLTALADFVICYPEILLYLEYNFLYEFFLLCKVDFDYIMFEVYRTQMRRASGRIPASSLLVLLGEPEVQSESELGSDEEEDSSDYEDMEIDNATYKRQKICMGAEFESTLSTRSRQSLDQNNYYSWGDSGLGTPDQQLSSADASELDTMEDLEEDGFIRKSAKQYEAIKCAKKYGSAAAIKGKPGSGQKYGKKTLKLKRFQCTVCPLRYAQKWNCNKHIRLYHPGASLIQVHKRSMSRIYDPGFIPPFLCPVCNKILSTKKSCENHITRYHPNTKATPQINPATLMKIEHAENKTFTNKQFRKNCSTKRRHVTPVTQCKKQVFHTNKKHLKPQSKRKYSCKKKKQGDKKPKPKLIPKIHRSLNGLIPRRSQRNCIPQKQK